MFIYARFCQGKSGAYMTNRYDHDICWSCRNCL